MVRSGACHLRCGLLGSGVFVKTLTERLQAADKALADLRADHAANVERIRADHAAEVQRLERQAAAADARAGAERDRLVAEHADAMSKLEERILNAEDRAGNADRRVDDVLAEVRALREALEDARRPWWRRWLSRRMGSLT
jgi:chromosome segregation ATPase